MSIRDAGTGGAGGATGPPNFGAGGRGPPNFLHVATRGVGEGLLYKAFMKAVAKLTETSL